MGGVGRDRSARNGRGFLGGLLGRREGEEDHVLRYLVYACPRLLAFGFISSSTEVKVPVVILHQGSLLSP